MSIILSILFAFTQLSVEHPSSGAVASVVPVAAGASAGTVRGRPGLDAEGGFSWVLQATLPNVVLIELSFADDSVGYACAELGIAYRTTNSGASWTRIMNLGFPYYWYGVSALSRDRVVFSGFNNTEGTGVYRWTTDGGSNWDSVVTLDTANWLSRAHFTDSLHGIISAGWNGGIWRTESGGRNSPDWDYVQVDPSRGWFEGNFCYRGDGHCRLTGISFCRSADHGASWDVQHSADPVFDGGVWFSDTLHGWTGGGQISAPVKGWVHRTTDGGATWSDRLIETPEPIRAVLFLSESLGFAVGGNHFTGIGAIYSTTDGGDSWRLDVNTGSEMRGIDYKVAGESIDVWCSGFNSSFTGCVYRTRIAIPGTGIRERGADSRRLVGRATVRQMILRRLPAGAVAFDASGRRVLDHRPGVFFLAERRQTGASGVNGAQDLTHCCRVIVAR
jgi:hypothetical protein